EHEVRQRLWRIAARRCIVAAGAFERPIVFPGNDVSGFMMASAMRSYIARYAAAPAQHITLFTNNDDGWLTVATALNAGLRIAAVVDARSEGSPAHRALAARSGFPVPQGAASKVHGGTDGVSRISVSLADGSHTEIETDGLAVSGGWNPAV